MPEIAIVTDSSACLPAELIERHGTIIVPLAFLFDGKLHHDGVMSSAEFFRRLETARKRVTTTAPAPGEFLDAFRRAAASGARAILCLTLSSQYSGTYSSAVNARDLAATELPGLRVEVLDTRGIAMAHGFAVLAAARELEAGGGLSEALVAARAVSASAHLVGVLDTMRYLAKSGRVPWIVHWAASALRIKPVLAATADRIYPIARARTLHGAIDRLLEYVAQHVDTSQPLHAAVMHAEAPQRAREICDLLAARFSPHEVLVTEFSSVMGVHTGPGFAGIAFYPGVPVVEHTGARLPSLVERDARRLEGSLGPLPARHETPALVVLVGLPGSGKSHFRRALAARYPLASLESDALRRVLFRRPLYTEHENGRLFPAMQLLLERLLARGISVAFDATNLREQHRRPLYRIAKRQDARLVVLHLTAPPEIVRRRLEARTTAPDPLDLSEAGQHAYEKMRHDMEPIGYPHLVIDTSQDIAPAIESVVAQLEGGS